jgi:outer membrane protein assembly factor BamD (BamD/ComL family)
VAAFRTVEQEFPGTEWSGSAAYAIAVTFAMTDNPQQDYGNALMEFDRFIEHYPQHDRLPEARAWRQAIRQLLDTRKENARLNKNIEQLKELDLQQEERRRGR